jgi:hypothetical protein
VSCAVEPANLPAAKDNLQYRVVRRLQSARVDNILRDDLIQLTGPARQAYPVELRRVVAMVEVDGELREMAFLTNNFTWSAQTIADLYRCRWSIEMFFKELKQTLQLADFLGPQRQRRPLAGVDRVAGLLVYLLLRFCAFLSQWGPPFQPTLHPPAFGPVAATGFARPARPLWDSRWRRPLPGHTRSGLFARFGLKLWDSRFSYHRPNHRILKRIFALVTRFLRKTPSDRHASGTCDLPLEHFNLSALTLAPGLLN